MAEISLNLTNKKDAFASILKDSNYLHSSFGIGIVGLPCLIQFPSTQIQSSSPEIVLMTEIKIIITKITETATINLLIFLCIEFFMPKLKVYFLEPFNIMEYPLAS